MRWVIGRGTEALPLLLWDLQEGRERLKIRWVWRFWDSSVHTGWESKKKKKSLKLHFIFIFIFQLKRLLFSHEKGRQPTCGFSRPSQRNQQWNVEQLGSFLALHRQGGERKKDFQILKQELQLLPWQKFSWEQAGRQLSSDWAGWKSGSEQRNGCDTQQHCCLPNSGSSRYPKRPSNVSLCAAEAVPAQSVSNVRLFL